MENLPTIFLFYNLCIIQENDFNETTIVKTIEAAASVTAEQPGTDHGFGKRVRPGVPSWYRGKAAVGGLEDKPQRSR